MACREDLTYEKRETKTLNAITGAADIDEALKKALYAIYDAQSFREYAKATGTDVVKKDSKVSVGMALGCFIAGFLTFFLILLCSGVI